MEKSPEGPSGTRRRTPRKSYSCTECTRRKLRCSKTIPCSACVDRGNSHLCQRRQASAEPGIPEAHQKGKKRRVRDGSLEATNRLPEAPTPPVRAQFLPSEPEKPESLLPSEPVANVTSGDGQQTQDGGRSSRQKIVDTVAGDAAVMLEFLALGRQRVVQGAQLNQSQAPGPQPRTRGEPNLLFAWPQAGAMLEFHQECIAWTHNVVHLPTFRREFEAVREGRWMEQAWMALYYAMLGMTFFHADPGTLEDWGYPSDHLMEWGTQPSRNLAESCYQKSIEALNAADFMSKHDFYCVQAICLLIYIGHNLGQSDRISVLLASAVRIAQCLGIHRLGPDEDPDPSTFNKPTRALDSIGLVRREVSKRVWWFLVRQDWLQIPFNNTYSIHPSQFNTPMPINCHEDREKMTVGNSIARRDPETYTQSSYTAVLNEVSVLIWKTQDRMCRHGHPKIVQDGLRKLYAEVIQADRELKQIIDRMPQFYKSGSPRPGLPPHIEQERSILCLTLAHKFYSIHRHFQIPSFKDPWFAYTKVSCFPMIHNGLLAVLDLPDDPHTSIIRNLWTVNTQIVTAAVWLLFELIFSGEAQCSPFDSDEMRDLIGRSVEFLQMSEGKSRIARRGITLIQSLMKQDELIQRGERKQFVVEDIIADVENFREERDVYFADQEGSYESTVDWLSRDAPTWENILNFMDMPEIDYPY